MKPEAQHICIAEACGWKEITVSSAYGSSQGIAPNVYPSLQNAPALSQEDKRPWHWIPRYTHDLNAMNVAERTLDRVKQDEAGCTQYDRYWQWLRATAGGDFVGASAAQRAEAFLRTIGKWTDT